MKKIFTLLYVLVLLAIHGVNSIFAQDPMIGKYEFTGGSKLPSYQADGVTFGSEFQVWNTTSNLLEITFDEENGYLIVKGTGTGIGGNCYGYISITPDPGKTVEISKVEVRHKKGNSITNRTRSYLYDEVKASPSIQAGLIQDGGQGLVIPTNWAWSSITTTGTGRVFTVQRFMSLAVNQTSNNLSNPAEWWVDELVFYGKVYEEGDVVMPVSVDFGQNCVRNVTVNNNIQIKGYNSEGNVSLTIEGPDAALFSLSQYTFTEAEVNAGVTVTASYTPASSGIHAATIKATYGTTEKFITLSAETPVLYETFDTKDMTGLSDNSAITNLNDFTVYTDWLTESINNWHVSGMYGFTPRIVSNETTLASYSTPELDLSQPFKITFHAKKLNNSDNGEAVVLVGQDTIMQRINPSNAFEAVSIDGYVATADSRVKFTGRQIENNRVAYDNIRITYTSSPATTLPLSSLQNFGTISTGSSSIIDIPLKAFNLEGDLSIAIPETGTFELLSGTTVSKATAESETGAVIQVKFNPVSEGTFNDKIVVSGGGLLTDGSAGSRTVYLSGEGSTTTVGVEINKPEIKLNVNGEKLNVLADGSSSIEVYSIIGHLFAKKEFNNSTQINLTTGVYLVRLRSGDHLMTQKIVIR